MLRAAQVLIIDVTVHYRDDPLNFLNTCYNGINLRNYTMYVYLYVYLIFIFFQRGYDIVRQIFSKQHKFETNTLQMCPLHNYFQKAFSIIKPNCCLLETMLIDQQKYSIVILIFQTFSKYVCVSFVSGGGRLRVRCDALPRTTKESKSL